MNKIKLHITFFLILIWSFSYTQQYTNYSTKNGLPSNHVYRITQDNKGFIWFITDKGMVKYNGTTFKTFTTKEGLPTNDIWDIRVTPDNKIWYFSKAAKLGYIDKDSVYAFSNKNNKILYPNVINQSRNKVFFSQYDSYFYLKDKQWKEKKNSLKNNLFTEKVAHAKVNNFMMDNKTDTLFVMDKNNKKLKKIIINTKTNKFKHRGQINDSLFVWIYTNKIKLLNLNTLTVYDSPIENTAQLTRFSNVNNKIQFSGENYVAFLDKNYQLSNYQYIPNKLHSHYSFVDKNKNLWIATFNNGVYFLPYSKQHANYQLVNEKVGKFKNIKGNIIANIYNKGFYKLDSVTKQFNPFIKIKDFIYSANIIKELNVTYYLADIKGVVVKNGVKKSFRNAQIARKLVYFNNKLYGYNSSGLVLIDIENYKIKQQFIQNGIRDMLIFNNKIVLATSNGIKYFTKDQILPLESLVTFDKPIVSLKKLNDKEIIICTDGFGAYISDLKKIKQFEKSNFLDVINAYLYKNTIFFATNKGVWKYKKENKSFKLKEKYTINDGLLSNNINDIFIKDNQLFTSSNNGISIIPLAKNKAYQFVAIYFDKLMYNDYQIHAKDAILYKPNSELQVKTSFIDFSEDKTHTYYYKLSPIQNKWISSQSQHISFNDLAPNTYQLTIKSNGKKESFNFIIKPLWYQKIITKIIFGLVLALLFISFILYLRKKELQKQEKKLKAQKQLADFELHALRSQMNPHFVFNSLNAIQYYITKNQIDLSEKYLVKFSRLIRMFFDFSREKEITLVQEIKLLKGYLEIEKMRFGNDFKYQFNVDNKLDIQESKIPTMLLQPIVENAVNHGVFHNGGKGFIEINFDYIALNSYRVTIKDDGVGVKKSKEIQNKSLKNMKSKTHSTQVLTERIDLLNQSNKWNVVYKLMDNATVKSGTTVQLTFTKNE